MTVLDMNSSVPQTREPRRETPSDRRMISGLNSGKEMSSEGQYPSNFPGLGKSSYSGPLHETKCDLLCDTKYLLHSSQYQKVSLCVGMPTTSNTTILLLAVCVTGYDDQQ